MFSSLLALLISKRTRARKLECSSRLREFKCEMWHLRKIEYFSFADSTDKHRYHHFHSSDFIINGRNEKDFSEAMRNDILIMEAERVEIKNRSYNEDSQMLGRKVLNSKEIEERFSKPFLSESCESCSNLTY